ncbi:MAG: hypothetical protein IJU81_01195 [Bacteroidales bacterium]|nr:hypothetical protein [Bacteroidales bacterium]
MSADDTRGAATGSGQFAQGTNCTITAVAYYGYKFKRWNDGDTSSSRTVTVTGNATYVAEFEARKFYLNVMTGNYLQGSVAGNGYYDYRTSVVVSATPRQGFVFSHWSDGNRSNPRRMLMTKDTALIAYFMPIANRHHLMVTSNDSEKGSARGTGYYYDSTLVLLSATAFEGNRFVAWGDGETANPRTIMITKDTLFMAIFESYQSLMEYTVNVSSNDEQMGTVSGGGRFTEGDTVIVVAYPKAHCHIMRWSDGNCDNPRTIVVAGNMNITALFASDSVTINVVSIDESMGFVSGGGTYPIGTELTISATPRDGYRFSHWNTIVATNPLTVTALYDRTYIAIFESLDGIDNAESNKISIWGSGKTIHVTGCEGKAVCIYDVAGHLVLYDGSGTAMRDFTMQNGGVYTVVVNDKAPFHRPSTIDATVCTSPSHMLVKSVKKVVLFNN